MTNPPNEEKKLVMKMRTRERIMKDHIWYGRKWFHRFLDRRLELEVLLDIRELLEKQINKS